MRFEARLAIVEKNMGALAHGIDDQIEIAVAVEVGQQRAARIHSRAANASAGGNVFKAPVAEVAVERVVTFKPAKINITEPVAIHVSSSYSATVEQNLVRFIALDGDEIRELNARSAGWQAREAGLAAGQNRYRRAAKTRSLLPLNAASGNRKPNHCNPENEREPHINPS